MKRFGIYIEAEDLETAKDIAKRRGLTLASWIREAVKKAIKRERKA